MEWPHDDTQSLISFYGRPWQTPVLLTHVAPPFQMTFQGAVVHGLCVHVKCAGALVQALNAIWTYAGQDQRIVDEWGISHYSGSFDYRNVRGAANLSCHAFGAALDFDAEKKPLGSNVRFAEPIVKAFKDVGAFWGGDFIHRKDPMHFQFAKETP